MTSDQENRLQDSEQTLDAEAQKERIRRNKKRILEAEEKSSTTHGGDKIEQIDLEDEYPLLRESVESRELKKSNQRNKRVL